MNIDIKKSAKPVKYKFAIEKLEKRLEEIRLNKKRELIWVLEHNAVFTAGTNFNEKEIIDKSTNIIKTNRGGKITYHGPGQLVFYFVIDLNKRGKKIRKLITIIENTIIKTLKEYKIDCFADKKNIGIWHKDASGQINKIAAIGIKVKKWIAYHGFSLNINNDLTNYKKIVPCGIKDKGITSLKKINNKNYNRISEKIIKNLYSNLKI